MSNVNKQESNIILYKPGQYIQKGSIGYQLWKEKKFAELDKHLKTIKWL